MSALHIASQSNSLRCARALLDVGGAQLDATNEWCETPLHLAAAAGHVALVEVLLAASRERQYDWQDAKDRWGRSVPRVAREHGELVVLALLSSDGADSDADNFRSRGSPSAEGEQGGRTAQHELLRQELLSTLCSRECDAAPAGERLAPQEVHVAPSAPALVLSTRRVLSKLVEYPPDTDAVRALLQTECVDLGGRDMFGLTALHKFAAWDCCELVELLLPLLSRECANARGGDSSWTALHYAADAGSDGAYAALLAAPALVDTEAVDKQGRTAAELLRAPRFS